MISGLPPKLLPPEDWASLSSALTWLALNHAFELEDLLEWAALVGPSEVDLRQLLSDHWQELIDHQWAREIRLKAKVGGGSHESISRQEWRPFRHVDWRHCSSEVPQLFLVSTKLHNSAPQTSGALNTLDDPLIWRADVIAFKKVRRRRRDVQTPPDYASAERDLRLMLSRHKKCTGLKWQYVEELVEIYHLPEYQAVRMWTDIARELGFPERGRTKKYRDDNSRQ